MNEVGKLEKLRNRLLNLSNNNMMIRTTGTGRYQLDMSNIYIEGLEGWLKDRAEEPLTIDRLNILPESKYVEIAQLQKEVSKSKDIVNELLKERKKKETWECIFTDEFVTIEGLKQEINSQAKNVEEEEIRYTDRKENVEVERITDTAETKADTKYSDKPDLASLWIYRAMQDGSLERRLKEEEADNIDYNLFFDAESNRTTCGIESILNDTYGGYIDITKISKDDIKGKKLVSIRLDGVKYAETVWWKVQQYAVNYAISRLVEEDVLTAIDTAKYVEYTVLKLLNKYDYTSWIVTDKSTVRNPIQIGKTRYYMDVTSDSFGLVKRVAKLIDNKECLMEIKFEDRGK